MFWSRMLRSLAMMLGSGAVMIAMVAAEQIKGPLVVRNDNEWAAKWSCGGHPNDRDCRVALNRAIWRSPKRFKILRHLAMNPGSNVNQMKRALKMSRSSLRHHLAMLKKSGLI